MDSEYKIPSRPFSTAKRSMRIEKNVNEIIFEHGNHERDRNTNNKTKTKRDLKKTRTPKGPQVSCIFLASASFVIFTKRLFGLPLIRVPNT